MHDHNQLALLQTIIAIKLHCGVYALGEHALNNGEASIQATDELRQIYPA